VWRSSACSLLEARIFFLIAAIAVLVTVLR
jgi:hypothetical protein